MRRTTLGTFHELTVLMVLQKSLLVLLVGLSACGRPSLSDSTLELQVLRRGGGVTDVFVELNDERFPCGDLGATVTLNGVALTTLRNGSESRGSYLFIPNPGCQPPAFELESPLVTGPFELRIEAGGEEVIVKSQTLLTANLVGPDEVVAGGTMDLVATSEFHQWAPLRSVEVRGPALEREDDDSNEVSWKKIAWRSWATTSAEPSSVRVPTDMPAGRYAWSASTVSVEVPVQTCSGVARCDVALSIVAEGEVSVTP